MVLKKDLIQLNIGNYLSLPAYVFLGFLMDNMIFSELEDLKDFGGHVFKVCPMMETVSCFIE